MPAGSLFGHAVTGPGSTGGIKHLVEMRAGKMNLKGILCLNLKFLLLLIPVSCRPYCVSR